jgi:hypothetical protein
MRESLKQELYVVKKSAPATPDPIKEQKIAGILILIHLQTILIVFFVIYKTVVQIIFIANTLF